MDYNLLLYPVAGNSIEQYIIFIASIAAGILIVKFFSFLFITRIKKYTKSTKSGIDDLIVDSLHKNLIPVMYFFIIYLCADLLNINSRFEKGLNNIFVVLFVFFITRFSISIILFLTGGFWGVNEKKGGSRSISILINMVIKALIWTMSVLILLDNLGIRISGLIAGLGVGGVAIAFASQSILRDIFNYFTIFFDHPFEIGDFLVIDEFKGTVEHIGLKTTRLRGLGGEEFIFANTDLTGSRVRNYKSMQERRVIFSFGVTYQTPVSRLKRIPDEIQKIIESTVNVRFDRAHFKKFGDSSLDFEAVYFVRTGEFNSYMDIQQKINIMIITLLKKMKVEFAYPTKTILIKK